MKTRKEATVTMNTRGYAISGTVVAALAATVAFGQWSVPMALSTGKDTQSKSLSVDFKSAKASQILDWMRKSGINFVVETTDVPSDKTYSVHIEGKSKEQVVEAIASALGLNATKKGDIYNLTSDFKWSGEAFPGWSQGDRTEWKDLGEKFKVLGPQLGKEFGDSWKDMDPKKMEEFQKSMKEWSDKMGDFKWEMPDGKDGSKFMWSGPDGKLKELDKQEFEKVWKDHMKDFPKLEFKNLPNAEFKYKMMGPDGKLKELDQKQFEKYWKDHMKDMPRIELKEMPEFNFKELPELKEHMMKLKELQPQIKGEIEKAMKERKSGLLEKERAMKELKDMKLPDVSKIKSGLGDIDKLMDSLTESQMERMKSQGHLKPSDLTPEQRKMLGDFKSDSNFVITFEKDGKRVTIKGE